MFWDRSWKYQNQVNFLLLKEPSNHIMPHRCVAGGCSNTAKDGVSLHGWPSNVQRACEWTNAVRNMWANFNQTASSKLCSSHFSDDSFETQSMIAHSLGLNMKKILKPSAVLTIFNNWYHVIWRTHWLKQTALNSGCWIIHTRGSSSPSVSATSLFFANTQSISEQHR